MVTWSIHDERAPRSAKFCSERTSRAGGRRAGRDPSPRARGQCRAAPPCPFPAPAAGPPRTRSLVRLAAPRSAPRTSYVRPGAFRVLHQGRAAPGPAAGEGPSRPAPRRPLGPGLSSRPQTRRGPGDSARAPTPPRHPAPPSSGSHPNPRSEIPSGASQTSGTPQNAGRTSDFRFFLFSSKFPPSLNPIA